ncbi:MAG: plastocyanin/azurin family copper-binding protein [bacterium]
MLRRRTLFVSLLIVAMSVVLVGCGGGGGDQTNQTTQQTEQEPQVDPATFGSLSVTVNYDGEEPEGRERDLSQYDGCGGEVITIKDVQVNDNGTLKNAVVSVKKGPDGLSAAGEDGGKVVVDQKNCQYTPHIVTAKTGQDVKITDSDDNMHNVRATKDEEPVFNETTYKGSSVTKTFDSAGVYKLVCDVHGWMNSWVYVTDHGKAAPTDETGSAKLSNLPPGDYTITIWHESLGSMTKDVSIGKKEDKSLEVTLSQS